MKTSREIFFSIGLDWILRASYECREHGDIRRDRFQGMKYQNVTSSWYFHDKKVHFQDFLIVEILDNLPKSLSC